MPKIDIEAQVLALLAGGEKTFKDLNRQVQVSGNTLRARLSELVEEGKLVEKTDEGKAYYYGLAPQFANLFAAVNAQNANTERKRNGNGKKGQGMITLDTNAPQASPAAAAPAPQEEATEPRFLPTSMEIEQMMSRILEAVRYGEEQAAKLQQILAIASGGGGSVR